jgi:hypothetical protein
MLCAHAKSNVIQITWLAASSGGSSETATTAVKTRALLFE